MRYFPTVPYKEALSSVRRDDTLLWSFVGLTTLFLAAGIAVWSALVPLPQVEESTARTVTATVPFEARSPRQGHIARIAITPGSSFREGDLLFELDTERKKTELEHALAVLRVWEEQLLLINREVQTLDLIQQAGSRASVSEEREAAAKKDRALQELRAASAKLRKYAELQESGHVDRGGMEKASLEKRLGQTAAAEAAAQVSRSRANKELSEGERAREKISLMRESNNLKAEIVRQKDSIALLRKELAQSEIRAPFDGIVVSLADLRVDTFVEGGALLGVVAEDTSTVVEGVFATRARAAITEGQRGRFVYERTGSNRGREIFCEVVGLNVSATNQSELKVKCKPPEELPLGIEGSLTVFVAERTLLQALIDTLETLRLQMG